MKRLLAPAVALLLLLAPYHPVFAQTAGLATVSGTITDSSGALIPGVTVKATAVDTSVVTSTVSNEAGVYTFASLLPGNYTLSATLPGFQTKNLTGIALGQGTAYRFNFELTVSGVNTQVEVSIAADSILATSGATIGQVLNQQRVSDLPMVGNNVLQLIGVLAGVENQTDATFGREGTTFAGISASQITTVRDGIMVQDTRWPTGISSATVINPDLVGEVRLILAPVDAEIGRGNGTVQIQTRSGTNKYTGAAVWSFRNTALDPNSWINNENQTALPGVPRNADGTPSAILRNWSNVHQGTVSYGGPIIKNKTFFFGLYDHNDARGRGTINQRVLTPCARNGVFRYYTGINSGNVNTAPAGGNSPTAPVVNVAGTPTAPQYVPGTENTTKVPYTGTLRYFGVFGSLASNPTTADCSGVVNAATLTPTGSPTFWDPYRRQKDPTGYVDKLLKYMPLPNNYETGDGLNSAGFRWLRKTRGLDNLWGVGEATGLRNQYNVKLDHNFNSNHKANVNVSYERVDSDDTIMPYPDTFSNKNYRRPIVVTSAFTSTLSSSLLNEARFGIRQTGTNLVAPWDRPEYKDAIDDLEPGPVNGFDRVFPKLEGQSRTCNPITGGRPDNNAGSGVCFGTVGAFGILTGPITSSSIDKTSVYTYADTMSWTKSAHSFRFGGELRVSRSNARVDTTGFFGDYMTTPHAAGGNSQYAPQGTTGPGAISGGLATHPFMPDLGNTDAANARGLQNYLAASLVAVRHLSFVANPNDLTTWVDGRTNHYKVTDLRQREMTLFFKDDYKLTKDLTLNLGARWEYYGVPYVGSGLTASPVGGGAAAFGISGRNFDGWMKPGARADLTALEFVGPNSPNPGKSVYKADRNNLGPAIGFAWQVPWFGGQTTVRGGYQMTFQTRGFSTIEGPLGNAPGVTYNASYEGDAATNPYLDLTDLPVALPVPISVKPMQPILINDRSATPTFFDANYVHPYVQNLTLSVTRNIQRNLTLDVRYVGTLARKQFTTLALNTPNFMHNGLLQEFDIIREGRDTGTNTPILSQMLSSITTNAATYLRTSNAFTPAFTTVGTDLANGAYRNIANWLATTNQSIPGVPSGVRGALLRSSQCGGAPCFPENFIYTNPQFSGVNLLNNMGYNNYHSVQTEVTFRPTHGISGQATYSWSKNLGLNSFADPVNRAPDYTNVGGNRTHQLRTNGTVELPFGPNKLVLGNSSGVVARAIERWQLGLIYNLSSGTPVSITSDSMLFANGRPDVAFPVDFNEIRKMDWGSIQAGNFKDGSYFEPNRFIKIDDPQCFSTVTSKDGLNAANRCTIDALAMIVPAGTPDSFVLSQQFPTQAAFATDTRSAVYVLRHPKPGKRGTLGSSTLMGLGTWRFDANLSKTFRISESKSLQVRIDTLNILNHPQPADPSLSITGFGLFGVSTFKTGNRSFQGQMRLTF